MTPGIGDAGLKHWDVSPGHSVVASIPESGACIGSESVATGELVDMEAS